MPRSIRRFTSFINLIYRVAFIVTFMFGAITFIVPHAKRWLTTKAKEKPKVTKKHQQAPQGKPVTQRKCRRRGLKNCNCR